MFLLLVLLGALATSAMAEEPTTGEQDGDESESDESDESDDPPTDVHAPPPSSPPPRTHSPEVPGWQRRGVATSGRAPTLRRGTYGQVAALGGAMVSGGAVVVWPSELAVDLSVGPRLGIGADLYANLMGMVGLTWTDGDRTRHGVFVRGGSTLPLATWYEAMVAGGYAVRIPTGGGGWIGADLGGGLMVVQDLPGGYGPWPGLAYMRWVVEVPTSSSQR